MYIVDINIQGHDAYLCVLFPMVLFFLCLWLYDDANGDSPNDPHCLATKSNVGLCKSESSIYTAISRKIMLLSVLQDAA